MGGLWVGLSIEGSRAQIENALRSWFPRVSIGFLGDLMASDGSWPDIVFDVTPNPSEYRTVLDIAKFPGALKEPLIVPVIVELARRFSQEFRCRTICDGSGLGDDASPYWAIVWEAGRSYLADDCGTLFGDAEGEPTRIVREIEVPRAILGSAAELLRIAGPDS